MLEDDECTLIKLNIFVCSSIFVQVGGKNPLGIKPMVLYSQILTQLDAMLPRWGDQMANDSASSHPYHPNSVTCSASQEHTSLDILKANLQLPKTTLNK